MTDGSSNETVATGEPRDRNPDGTLRPGHSGTVGRAGVPSKIAAIRQAVWDTFDLEALNALKTSDPRTYWTFFSKTMPQQVQAEVGALGSFSEEFDAALKRAGVSNNGKTTLGEVPK